ncbi:hypothetical protein Anas_09887, partial [Armadillidium nasatum]
MTSQLKTIPGGTSFLGDDGPTEGYLFASVLPYVLMIILLPIGSFFIAKKTIFQDIFGYSDTSANVYSALLFIKLLHKHRLREGNKIKYFWIIF